MYPNLTKDEIEQVCGAMARPLHDGFLHYHLCKRVKITKRFRE